VGAEGNRYQYLGSFFEVDFLPVAPSLWNSKQNKVSEEHRNEELTYTRREVVYSCCEN
jgi:hypothetical protein